MSINGRIADVQTEWPWPWGMDARAPFLNALKRHLPNYHVGEMFPSMPVSGYSGQTVRIYKHGNDAATVMLFHQEPDPELWRGLGEAMIELANSTTPAPNAETPETGETE